MITYRFIIICNITLDYFGVLIWCENGVPQGRVGASLTHCLTGKLTISSTVLPLRISSLTIDECIIMNEKMIGNGELLFIH